MEGAVTSGFSVFPDDCARNSDCLQRLEGKWKGQLHQGFQCFLMTGTRSSDCLQRLEGKWNGQLRQDFQCLKYVLHRGPCYLSKVVKRLMLYIKTTAGSMFDPYMIFVVALFSGDGVGRAGRSADCGGASGPRLLQDPQLLRWVCSPLPRRQVETHLANCMPRLPY